MTHRPDRDSLIFALLLALAAFTPIAIFILWRPT